MHLEAVLSVKLANKVNELQRQVDELKNTVIVLNAQEAGKLTVMSSVVTFTKTIDDAVPPKKIHKKKQAQKKKK